MIGLKMQPRRRQPGNPNSRSRRPYILAALLFAAWWIFTTPRFDKPYQHRITVDDVRLQLPRLDFSPGRDHSGWYDSESARRFCRGHGYNVFYPSSTSGARKVYDLLMVNSELDHLEVRLDTLYDFVDYFIIVEAPKTFQGNDKPLTISANWERFKRFHPKMIYHKLEYPKGFSPKRSWDYEDLQRDAMFDQVLTRLTGPRAPEPGDAIIVADVDEIPRPVTALVLRTCAFPRRLTLASKFYYYSYQFLHKGPEWPHPQATYYEGKGSTIRPTNLRNGDGGLPFLRDLDKATLSNAGWHCSGCFSTMKEFLNRMASFSHEWMNAEEYRNKDRIAQAVREGRDLWARPGETFTRIEGNLDIPPILKDGDDADKERLRYMLDRDGLSAGFSDYPPQDE
ncbi:hypothetical protein NLU13_5995 [Sarocladium strictum]|uniref:Uncharacterized protein n=1 Tax=Sarocladium strictum TaxID=5046 RepID=A0AA39GGC8_SARSR|nr:hypothetical protein NLU13_5995 [Sarocladium strictum]